MDVRLVCFVLLLSCTSDITLQPVAAQVRSDRADRAEKLTLVRALVSDPQLPQKVGYAELVADREARRLEIVKRWKNSRQNRLDVKRELLVSIQALTERWMGTTWALGNPQSKVPGENERINCGTFVGRVLNDAGFKVKVSHLQRQPAQLIIQSFVGGERVRKFSNKKMKSFINSVKEMGPGLYIIGLDFHVGTLLQTENDLRFIHASYENEKVRNEKAADATPIISSKYRVVGKILSDENILDWVKGRRIKVKGKW